MVNAGLQLSFKMSKQIAPFALETFGCQTFVSKRICEGEIRSITSQMYWAAIPHELRRRPRTHLRRSKWVVVRKHDVNHKCAALVRRALLHSPTNERQSNNVAGQTCPPPPARWIIGGTARTGPRSDPFQ
jgi:hypothetical protein